MDAAKGKKTKLKRPVFTSSAFLAFTTLALVLGIILIILSRMGYTREGYFTFPSETVVPSTTPSSVVFVSGNSRGSLDAPVTIIVYSDFQCSHCQEFALTIEKQLQTAYIDTGKVLFIYKHIIAYDEESQLTAEASEAAAEQGKFWPYHDLLMQARASPKTDDLPISKLQSLAQQVGLDMETFNASLESGKYKKKVMQEDAEGRATGITGIPAFFVNGVKMDDSQIASFEGFQKVIDDILRSLPSEK